MLRGRKRASKAACSRGRAHGAILSWHPTAQPRCPLGRWQRYPRNLRQITYVARADEGTGSFQRPKLADVSRLCFQTAVDFMFSEKCQVKDYRTGTVLKGPSEQVSVLHRVVYEADLGYKVTPDYQWRKEKRDGGDDDPPEWKIVDVDEILGGHGHPYCTPPAHG